MMKPDEQSNPPKKKGGCFPFGCGCFTGILLTLFMLASLVSAVFFFGGLFLEKSIGIVYQEHIRPQLLQTLPLTEDEKKKFVGELDDLINKFPTMTMEEKKLALKKLLDQLPVKEIKITLPSQEPTTIPATP